MLNLIRAIIIIGAGASQQTHAVYSGGVENQGVQIALQEFAAANANLADKPMSRATHTTLVSPFTSGGSTISTIAGNLNTLNGDDISSINVMIELIELYRQHSLLANQPMLRW